MITIKDVANHAGVSLATASYALNGEGRIAPETRLLVQRAARDLGYVPHIGARSLKGQKARAVGIFVDGIAGPIYGELIEGAQEFLKSQGWGLVVATLNEPVRELVSSLVGGSLLAGAMVFNTRLAPTELMETLLRRTPTILLDADPAMGLKAGGPGCLRVTIDNASGMRDIARHLLEQGCRRFAYLDGTPSSWDARERRESFAIALAAAGLQLPESHVIQGGFRTGAAHQALQRWLGERRDLDALVCANDEMALGAIRALREVGLSVPRDLVVTGFDDIEQSAWSHPSLSTVTVRRRELGETMAARLLHLIQFPPGEDEAQADNLRFPVSLTIRESSQIPVSPAKRSQP